MCSPAVSPSAELCPLAGAPGLLEAQPQSRAPGTILNGDHLGHCEGPEKELHPHPCHSACSRRTQELGAIEASHTEQHSTTLSMLPHICTAFIFQKYPSQHKVGFGEWHRPAPMRQAPT